MAALLFSTPAFLMGFFLLAPGQRVAQDGGFAAYFSTDPVPEIRISLSEPAKKSLREKQREFTVCTLVENGGKPWTEMAIKLKGAAGSFRELNDRPALTLNAGRNVKGREFHGMRKFHLNNSVQDGTLLHEFIGAELFRQAGCPSVRVGWARVWLDGRDMGLYVLKEGFDQNFLKRHFANPNGNLYDGGFCQDLDAALELDEGPDAKSPNPERKDLKAVVAACREPDAAKRQAALEKLVDIDSLLTFMAMELMLCHWDGYTGNKNNYRVYFDPKLNGKLRFLPHGMDQLLGDMNFPIWGTPSSMVPGAVIAYPNWRKAYRERLIKLRPLFDAKNTDAIIDKAMLRLGPAAKAQGGENALKNHTELAKQMKQRLQERARNLDRLIKEIPVVPEPLPFSSQGTATLASADWFPQKVTEDATTRQVDNGKALEIAVGPSKDCIASWRSRLLLPKGKYRLEIRMKPEGVTSPDEGATIRVSGRRGTGAKVTGTSDWQVQKLDFEVTNDNQETTLVAELRATAGRLLVNPAALIVQVK